MDTLYIQSLGSNILFIFNICKKKKIWDPGRSPWLPSTRAGHAYMFNAGYKNSNPYPLRYCTDIAEDHLLYGLRLNLNRLGIQVTVGGCIFGLWDSCQVKKYGSDLVIVKDSLIRYWRGCEFLQDGGWRCWSCFMCFCYNSICFAYFVLMNCFEIS